MTASLALQVLESFEAACRETPPLDELHRLEREKLELLHQLRAKRGRE